MAKEIIIDEIDVSGCVDYGLFGCCHHYDSPCKEHSDCYFKKHKRKEQECDRLKEQSKNKCAFRCLGNEFCPDAEKEIEELKTAYNDILTSCKNEQIESEKLKAECEKLKAECEKTKRQYNCYACDTCNGKEDYRNMKRHCESAIKALHESYAENEELKKRIKTFTKTIIYSKIYVDITLK